MGYLATTRGAILRGSAANTYGDEIDDNGPGDENVVEGWDDFPVSLLPSKKTVFDPATATRRTIRDYHARVPSPLAAVLVEGDRFRDNRTGYVYSIEESVHVPRTLAAEASLTLDLKDRTTIKTPA